MEYTPNELAQLRAVQDVREAIVKAPWNVGQKKEMLQHAKGLKQSILQGVLDRIMQEHAEEDEQSLMMPGAMVAPHDLVATTPQASLVGSWLQWWEPIEKRLKTLGFVSVPCNCGENIKKMHNPYLSSEITAELDKQNVSCKIGNTFLNLDLGEGGWIYFNKRLREADVIQRYKTFIDTYGKMVNPQTRPEENLEPEDHQLIIQFIDKQLQAMGFYSSFPDEEPWMKVQSLKGKKGKSVRRLKGSYIASNHRVKVEEIDSDIRLELITGESDEDYEPGESLEISILTESDWILLFNEAIKWDIIKVLDYNKV